ncbi:periplasmic heavy metal sensor [Pseudomonas sp. NFACC37-1]|uniref:periplasmic heavy metal sensor n=1 Tax=Pseudomonas sp. NFACC37-1 TaxID=1566196 RepID=UPI0008851121|nr:periplasmic heavy metal sensor [Pseudomonas sp. NFACC37-1]SCY64997.1 Heavy-metal resistance [Pseudomonas sp. NFACC37-1]
MNKTRLLSVALLLSLGANAFLGGWLLNRPNAVSFELGQNQLVRELIGKVRRLPDEQRQDVRAVISQHAPGLRKLAAQTRSNRQVILDQLSADSIDRQQVQTSFAKQREATVQLQTAAQVMLLDIAEKLPPEQRRQFMREGP